jgi:aldose 1-epimerase
VSLTLEYLSPDGEEGYPGDVRATVIYKLADDTLEIDYTATTDRDTIVSLTNHSYFNLAGSGDILSHELMLNAGSFTPVSEDLIPTGEIKSVENTPMDFRNEPQHFPDAPNHANFPSTVLRPGEIYRHTSVYRFTCA